MGRRKIQIQPIKDDRNRQVTFLKRKHGLMKKAYELSVLCNCEVALVIIPQNNNKMIQYSSSDMNTILKRFKQNDKPKEVKTNKDFVESKDNEVEDEDEYSLRQQQQQQHLVTSQQQPILIQPNMMYNSLLYSQQTPALYHSPQHQQQEITPDQSPRSEPGTPDNKRPKQLIINPEEFNYSNALPSQFVQNLPSPSTFYPEFYPQSNFIMSPIHTNSAFTIPTIKQEPYHHQQQQNETMTTSR
ncbi:uncharacterized protein BX663DRAFT_527479 [Cokeromyces recurvatus]|uniref:uncharacterized protein n=1 Tax=Cokeromyces recurvatus TaxID=90255 RepID=UPI00221ED9D0|nr:uncharacterized protein BX663DRAFT_527479 [Cokeromyces recurvatus]KAI7897653.1 hypothetical protein BX663DRAFT_527479 [Cokeromyces recurvatus]